MLGDIVSPVVRDHSVLDNDRVVTRPYSIPPPAVGSTGSICLDPAACDDCRQLAIAVRASRASTPREPSAAITRAQQLFELLRNRTLSMQLRGLRNAFIPSAQKRSARARIAVGEDCVVETVVNEEIGKLLPAILANTTVKLAAHSCCLTLAISGASLRASAGTLC
jgi:hypothetical protein